MISALLIIELSEKDNFGRKNSVKHLILLLVLFFIASVAAFIAGMFFGSLGAGIVLGVGLIVAFIQISVAIGR